jgi:hypothetical protein
MSKNLIPQIAQMLGVEVGEDFRIKGYIEPIYRFDADGLKTRFDSCPKEGLPFAFANAALGDLIAGKLEIIKIPWKPKNGEDYYTFSISAGKWIVCRQRWTNHPIDFALLDKGWIYHSKKGAEDALPALAEEMGVKYKLI